MFIGSINRYMRAVLSTAASQWKGLPVFVACSGNFTVERILAQCGVGAIHSNDVSIYSCALGWHLTGQARQYRVKLPAFDWLNAYLEPGAATVATLLLAGEMLKLGGNPAADPETLNPYARRMRDEYRRRWPDLHAKTVERVTKATASLAATAPIASYFAGDCREFLARAAAADKSAKSAVCISFPPTYQGGYERLYKKLDALFDWPAPTYQTFGPEDFEAFSATVRSFRHWMISSDTEQAALSEQGSHVATVQTSLLSKPVFMYSDSAPTRLATARQTLGVNRFPPRTDEVVEPIQVVRIDAKVLNAIRSLYLAQTITPCDGARSYVVLSGKPAKLVGAFAFAFPRGVSGLACDIYLLSDFAVRPTPHRRLAKLILAAVVSKEVQADLEQWLCARVRTIGTTAFTDKPISMKYRGIFEVHNRSEGKVNYIGPAGQWSLQEGYAWWRANHAGK